MHVPEHPAISTRQSETPINNTDQVTDVADIIVWHDALVDPTGFAVDDPYVETFWLPVLGPTASWLLRRLASGLDLEPQGYRVHLPDLARAIGVSSSGGRHSPFSRALHRCTMFGVVQQVAIEPVPVLAVRRRLPRIARRHVDRLPDHLRDIHPEWQSRPVPRTKQPSMQ